MTVVSLKPNIYDNADGLRIFEPGSATTLSRGGEYNYLGGRVTEVYLELAALEAFGDADDTIVEENVYIPAGAFIEKIEVFVTKEPTGANANLDLGLVRTDRSTELDFNGFLAAADAFHAGTDLGTSTTYTVGTTEVGALVGTVLAYTGLITARADTADFTAGQLRIRVFWFVPKASAI